MNEYEFHPIANLFPLIEGDDFDNLCDDIRSAGLRQNIMIFEGKILDGRNRYRACLRTGEKPRFVDYLGDDPFGYVAAQNLLRRHLSPPQRAIIAAEMANMQRGGQQGNCNASKNESAHVQIGLIRHKINTVHDGLHKSGRDPQLISHAQAAERMGVSTRSVTSASRIIARGTPELVAAVKSDTISIRAAEVFANLPAEEQFKLISEGSSTVAQATKAVHSANGARKPRGLRQSSKDACVILTQVWRQTNDAHRERFIRDAVPSVSAVLMRMAEKSASETDGGDV